MTLEEMKSLPEIDQINLFKKISAIRKPAKVTNYSSLYGVGKAKLARTIKSTEADALVLLNGFWKRNWAIKKIADESLVKKIGDQMWLFNPTSKFWYTLRYDKDRWSTLNQGTGVYVFDTWIRLIRNERPQLTAQMHDEIVIEIKKGYRDKAEKLIRDSMKKVNGLLKLNVEITVDVQFGQDYSQIH